MTDKRIVTCAECGFTFEPSWSDEEAKAEAARNYPGLRPEEAAVVCDNCFKEITARRGFWA